MGGGRLQIKSREIKGWPIFGEREQNRGTQEEASHSKVESQQTQPTYGVDSGIDPAGHIGGRLVLSPSRGK